MLFSKRYANLITKKEDGELIDNICGEINYDARQDIVYILEHFDEPINIKEYRYSNYITQSSAMEQAALKFAYETKVRFFSLNNSMSLHEQLLSCFTPYLFDFIELQYISLSIEERKDFQNEINKEFQKKNIPWILMDGRLIKIDSKQFECDLQNKALEEMREIKDCSPKFQSAYEELLNAFEFYEQGHYCEAISNAEKSYESVIKVLCNVQNGTANSLCDNLIKNFSIDFPATMKKDGFRDNVLRALPYIRNNTSSDHGAGQQTVVVSKQMAKLALNLACSFNTFLVGEYAKTEIDNTNNNDDMLF